MRTVLLIWGGCLSGLILFTGMVIGQAHGNSTIDIGSTGILQGFVQDVLGVSINTFLAVPFAEPPLGNLRFKRPRPVTRRVEIIQANKHPKTCLQSSIIFNETGADKFMHTTELSEDCLYLNIWAPTPTPDSSRSGYAVLVWIHGGGYINGGISVPTYDGKFMAAEAGVVVVSVQYRLGLFGFLYSGTSDAPGNMGLLDQYLALKWVYDNIHSFGGDNSRITIFGESAGGHSVLMHALSPLPKYFRSGIIQSSPDVNLYYRSTEYALEKFLEIGNSFGCSGTTSQVITCINNTDVELLIDYTIGDALVIVTIDERFFTSSPELRFDDVTTPLLVGSNEDEGNSILYPFFDGFTKPYGPPIVTREELRKKFPFVIQFDDEKVTDYVIDLYSEILPIINNNFVYVATAIAGDFYFTCPARRFVTEVSSQTGNDVFLYRMRHRSSQYLPPDWHGATHASEIDHVFGVPLNQSSPYSGEERILSRRMVHLWSNLAKTGNPNKNDEGDRPISMEWPVYNTVDRETLILDTPEISVERDLQKVQCDFWNKVFPDILNGGQLENLLRQHGLPEIASGAETQRWSSLVLTSVIVMMMIAVFV